MRYFEILILASLLFTIVILFFVNKSRRALILSAMGITAIVVLCHLLFEKSRWQMVPAYILAIILFSIGLHAILSKGQKKPAPSSIWGRLIRISGISFTFLLLLLTSVPPSFLPVFRIPKPTGPFDVGTNTLFFTDYSRMDIHSEETGTYRELSVRIWYPAEVDGSEKSVPYMKAEEARALAELYHMPAFLLGHFTRIHTDSYLNAPPIKGTCPMVFYSPSGDMVQNTTLFQELASHGYVVISAGHPYWNAFSYDTKGQVVPFDNENAYYTSMWEEEFSDTVNALKEMITTASDLEEKRIAQKRLNQYMPLEIADIRLWAEDLSFLLDEFTDSEQNLGGIVNHLDASRVGVMGFSKGGSAAAQFCVTDSRCRAGVNLSGFMFGDAVNLGIPVPFMFLENREEWCQDCNPVCEVLYRDAKNEALMVRIKDARHGNFSDWSLVGGFLKIAGIIGPINGKRCLEIQNQYIRAFFDSYLKGNKDDLLTGILTPYPEVSFESRNSEGN